MSVHFLHLNFPPLTDPNKPHVTSSHVSLAESSTGVQISRLDISVNFSNGMMMKSVSVARAHKEVIISLIISLDHGQRIGSQQTSLPPYILLHSYLVALSISEVTTLLLFYLFCLGLVWISVEGRGALVNILASKVGGALCIVGSTLEVGGPACTDGSALKVDGPAIGLFALPS
nr:hypothetical protein CFP56_65040 [Quercus suber]